MEKSFDKRGRVWYIVIGASKGDFFNDKEKNNVYEEEYILYSGCSFFPISRDRILYSSFFI